MSNEKEIIDEKAIKERFKALQLKLPLKELDKLPDKEREQLYGDLYYLQDRLQDIAANKDAYFIYDISPHRRLYISIKKNCVNLYIYDSAKECFTQYVLVKELLRISKADSLIIRELKNFDKEKNAETYKTVYQTNKYIRVILKENETRGSPNQTTLLIDNDFDYYQE